MRRITFGDKTERVNPFASKIGSAAYIKHIRTVSSVSQLKGNSLDPRRSLQDIGQVLSERLDQYTTKTSLLHVDMPQMKPHRKGLIRVSTRFPQGNQSPSSKNLNKGLKLFDSLFGFPERGTKRIMSVKIKGKVRLPRRFRGSSEQKTMDPACEPYAPTGKKATIFCFRELAGLDTTVARRQSTFKTELT